MKFLIENFLLLSTTRQKAEIDMYMLVMAIKDSYTRHPMIYTFARMLALVDGNLIANNFEQDSVKEMKDNMEKKKPSPVKGRSNSDATPSNTTKKLVLSDCALALPICTVYLYARSCLLREYSGML